MRRLLPIIHVFALVAVAFAGTMLAPLAVALLFDDGVAPIFAISIAATGVGGAVLAGSTVRSRRELQARDAFLLVSVVWTGLPLFATVPLLLYFGSTAIPLSFTDAYFETVSGLTTTGATTLTGLDALPPSINFWRCLLQWIGGMGILVLAVAILPLIGSGGMQLFKAETAGPLKDTKLTPRITETAKGLWTVYCVISAACVLAYRAGGMSWLDAWIHMFTTMSLGGLSSHDASFAHFDSPLLEWTAVSFMLLASCNFALYFVAAHQRSLTPLLSSKESQMTLLTMVGSVALVALFLEVNGVYADSADALRYAAFNVVSIASTTGFASTDYGGWPTFAPVLMVLLSCFATSAGSTGAGIKMVRAIILGKQAIRELTRIQHARAVVPFTLEGSIVENKVVFSVLAFMLMYGATAIVATLLLLVTGMDPVSSFTAVLACVNNMGPGLGEVGPSGNYAGLSDFQVWVCVAAMLLGRLEMFSLLVLLTPAYWRR